MNPYIIFTAKGFLPVKFDIIRLSETNVLSRVIGERFLRARHRLRREIKAVTSHKLKIVKKGNKFRTDIIFDV